MLTVKTSRIVQLAFDFIAFGFFMVGWQHQEHQGSISELRLHGSLLGCACGLHLAVPTFEEISKLRISKLFLMKIWTSWKLMKTYGQQHLVNLRWSKAATFSSCALRTFWIRFQHPCWIEWKWSDSPAMTYKKRWRLLRTIWCPVRWLRQPFKLFQMLQLKASGWHVSGWLEAKRREDGGSKLKNGFWFSSSHPLQSSRPRKKLRKAPLLKAPILSPRYMVLQCLARLCHFANFLKAGDVEFLVELGVGIWQVQRIRVFRITNCLEARRQVVKQRRSRTRSRRWRCLFLGRERELEEVIEAWVSMILRSIAVIVT